MNWRKVQTLLAKALVDTMAQARPPNLPVPERLSLSPTYYPATNRSAQSDAPGNLEAKQARLRAQKQRQLDMRRQGVAASLLFESASWRVCLMCRAFHMWRAMPPPPPSPRL